MNRELRGSLTNQVAPPKPSLWNPFVTSKGVRGWGVLSHCKECLQLFRERHYLEHRGIHSSHPRLAWYLPLRAWIFSGSGLVFLNNSPASAKNFSNPAGEIISTSLARLSVGFQKV